jgi:hypothetical protein
LANPTPSPAASSLRQPPTAASTSRSRSTSRPAASPRFRWVPHRGPQGLVFVLGVEVPILGPGKTHTPSEHSRSCSLTPRWWVSMKGTGLSPYICPAKSTWALAPEGMLLQSDLQTPKPTIAHRL